jgi:AraC-like DNA-binding protein
MPGEVEDIVWSHNGYIAYVQSGKKTWISPNGSHTLKSGDAIYCKKGGNIVHSFYEEQFCALVFFFPENFVRDIVLEIQEEWQLDEPAYDDSTIMRLKVNISLRTFFESVMSYFLQEKNPSSHLLRLKFKELVLQVITGETNPALAARFLSMAKQQQVGLKQLMLDNYRYSLTLYDYARLCNQSLSTFKRKFIETFGKTPGRWLIEQRLKYAKMLIVTTEESIGDIAFHSGFNTASNFNRCFKKIFGHPPMEFRQKYAQTK